MSTNQKATAQTARNAAVLAALDRFRALNQKVGLLAELGLKESLARPPAERMAFLQSLEEARALHRAELNALTRVVTEYLGVDSAVWLKTLNEEVEIEVERLEKELHVAGWDKTGNPVVAQRKKS